MQFVTTEEACLLDQISAQAPDSSRTTLRSWIQHKQILVDEIAVVRANSVIPVGKTIRRCRGQPRLKAGLEVLYQDRDIVVVNKPNRLLSVARDSGEGLCAHGILKDHFSPHRVYVVHRLDRDTSGIMLFALSRAGLDGLKELLKDHKIERTYNAILEGAPQETQGTWDCFVHEGEDLVVRRTTDEEKGQRAITHYTVLKQGKRFTSIEFSLETGRKNQIRVHCQEAGCSIAGDRKYGARDRQIGRLCLHARRLVFTHPTTGKRMDFEVAIPPLFQHLVP